MFPIPVQEILAAALVFIRISGIVFALPKNGEQPTPVRVRILISVALSFGIYPLISGNWHAEIPDDVIVFAVYLIKELLIGLMIGFVAKAAFQGLLMAASMVGYQMGFGTANLFIPDAEAQMDGFSAFHRIAVMLLFLFLDLHHIFINAIVETFRFIPAGMAFPHGALGTLFIQVTAEIFYVAIQLAAPILVALMFATAALGLVARTVPQMNVFVISFPVNFFIGLLVYIATLPFFPQWMTNHFEGNYRQIYQVIRGLMP